MRLLALIMIIMMTGAGSVFAHKVIATVYTSGSLVEGEIVFSNGDSAQDVPVEVLTLEGEKLGEVRTDQEGFFTFEPRRGVAHLFRANLGAGHIAEVILTVEELPTGLALEHREIKAGANPEASVDDHAHDHGHTHPRGPGLSDEDAALIAELVRREINPLRKELALYKEENDLQKILGGLGYILGLAGLWFYWRARSMMKGKD